MDDDQAIVPDKTDLNVFARMKQQINKFSQDEGELHLYTLSREPSWGILKTYLLQRIEAFKTLSEVSIDGTESMSDIGTRFMLASMVVTELQGIISKVETTAAVIRENQEKQHAAPNP